MPDREPDPEVLDRLDAQDWDNLYEDLVAYAQTRLNQVSWVRGPDALPGGKDAEDFVQEAIRRLYTGQRTWDYETYPNLQGVLKGIISSMVSNLVTSAEHRRSEDIEKPGSEEDFYEVVRSSDADVELEGEEILEIMKAAVDDDPVLSLVFDAMRRDDPIGEIAEVLEVDRNRVYQLRRNVRRRIRKALPPSYQPAQ